MVKENKEENKQDIINEIILKVTIIVGTFYLFYVILLYFTDKIQFLHWLIYGIITVLVILGFRLFKRYLFNRKEKKIINILYQNNLLEYIDNFITRFGLTKKGDWAYRNYTFEESRLEDLRQLLIEKGVKTELKDLHFILVHLINTREYRLTKESIGSKPQLLANLNDFEFEMLIYRLFEAMSYKVEHTGHPKDQGGDLIINKGPERKVIQVKRYINESVGNKAVQEVVAARNYYNCNGAIVVASSDFTQEAIALARSNNTQLINKKELQRLLSTYLKANWA